MSPVDTTEEGWWRDCPYESDVCSGCSKVTEIVGDISLNVGVIRNYGDTHFAEYLDVKVPLCKACFRRYGGNRAKKPSRADNTLIVVSSQGLVKRLTRKQQEKLACKESKKS